MIITWDEPKRRSNLDKHGLDFADLVQAFFSEAAISEVQKGRLKAVGRIGPKTITVVFAFLGREGLSVISMRPANWKERMLLL